MATSAQLLDTLLETLPEKAMIATDAQGLVTHWSIGARRMFGYAASEAIGQHATTILQRQEGAAAITGRVIAEGAGEATHRYRTKDGNIIFAAGHTSVVRDAEGTATGYLTVLKDKHDDHAEAEFMRSVLAASDDCIKVLDLDANLTFMSEGGQRVMEVSDFNQLRGCSWPSVWSGGMNAVAQAAVDEAKAGRRSRFQGAANTAMGTPKWWDVQVSPIVGLDGTPEMLLSVSRDITDLKRSEEQQKLLSEELAHRVKNTLALVQALATQTLRRASSIEEGRRILIDRIQAMARASDLLVTGQMNVTSLDEIVRNATAGLAPDAQMRVTHAGDPLDVGAKSALSIALLLHELATNAVKYGALSEAEGRVRIDWRIAEIDAVPQLVLTWSEHGGPATVAQPQHKGFGSRLIDESLPKMLNGTAHRRFDDGGLSFQLKAPLAGLMI